jgi:hypothetical protein
LNSDGDLDYEVCEEDEEALLAGDEQVRIGVRKCPADAFAEQVARGEGAVLDARERIQQRKQSKADDEWDEEEEDEDKEGRGRFLSERAPNPQQTAPSRPREDIPDSLEQVQLPESDANNHRIDGNFRGRGGRGRGRGGRFFHRGNFR